jgi:predicted deacylase
MIAGREIPAGKRVRLELPTARLVSGSAVAVPLVVLHGRRDGPTVWISSAIHGDELNGVEIVREVLTSLDIRQISGTLVAAPIVNVHGFNAGQRSLPDGRDLNRSFPGSRRGSMASRIADIFMREVVSRCQYGFDLHTGSGNRVNLPQVRAGLDDPATMELAQVFAAPIAINAKIRDGSIRGVASGLGAVALLFEGGEANRFDQAAIDVGVNGIRRCLAHIGMTPPVDLPTPSTLVSHSSRWTRAPRSGILHLDVELGDKVSKGEEIAALHDPYGKRLSRIKARSTGIVIGRTHSALINQGEAIVHVASVD